MKKYHTSAMVIIPPKEEWAPIQKIRYQYDKRVNRWMPHITLLYPFYSKADFLSIKEEIQNKCYLFNQFQIQLATFQYFHHKYQSHTIYLQPEPINPIIELQKILLTLAPECNDVTLFKGGFHPHLSVGQMVTYNINSKIAELQKSWDPLEFKVHEIYFITRENKKNARFQIQDVILLKD